MYDVSRRDEQEVWPPGEPARTLVDALRAGAQATSRGIVLLGRSGGQERRTWAQTLSGAMRYAAALEARGLPEGARVLTVTQLDHDAVQFFFGAVAAGVVPMMLASRSDTSLDASATAAVLERVGKRFSAHALAVDAATPRGARPLANANGAFSRVLDLAELRASVPAGARPERDAPLSDVAYIQITPGATGAMRGVALTHQNILSNVDAIGRALELRPDDVGAAWLPLDNIMGLLGFVCLPCYWGIDTVLLDPRRFLDAPHEWLWAISQHRATLTAAPDFGYHYCVRRARETHLEHVDLSSLRVAMSGGERAQPEHMSEFVSRFAPFGLSPDVFTPVYGLSEGTLGVAFSPPGRPPKLERVRRGALTRDGLAKPADEPADDDFVGLSVGHPLEGVELRVVSPAGEPLPERTLGELAFRGPNAMAYSIPREETRDESATRRANGWVLTGDVGYLAGGEVFVVERACDVVELPGGRSFFPSEAEARVGRIDGVRAGAVAFFGAPRASGDGEDLVGAFEIQRGASEDEIARAIPELLRRTCGVAPERLVPVSPGSIPRTRDGKVRRRRARELYLQDRLELSKRERAPGPLTRIARGASLALRVLRARISRDD
jgi:acyl-CoA synthetase (AMP-forming)/AMP-acid ligase II